ncbi:MAG: glycosyltransferase family 9 protein [Candidatus Omnitrophota bacterium]
MINKILFFTLSNFGDVILTLPVLDVLRENYPDAKITVIVGPRALEIFKDNPHIHNLIVYDKYARLREKTRLFFDLAKQGFDLVVDLRNTLFGALLPAQFRTSPFLSMPKGLRHIKERNLYRLIKALGKNRVLPEPKKRLLYLQDKDENYISLLLKKNRISESDNIIIVAPAAGGKTRRWGKEKFIQLCDKLAEDYSVILIGRKEDKMLTRNIQAGSGGKVMDFAGMTNLAQLSCLLKKARLVVVSDTGILHLASYLDVGVVGIFGPSDEEKYGPWSKKSRMVSASIPCRPCRQPECRFKTIECMQKISVGEVLYSIDDLLKS